MSLAGGQGRLLRRPLVAEILQGKGNALVVTGLGSPTYDVAAAGDRDETFYLWGAMGLAAMTGLGLALARPERRVLVVTGDGEMLMGAGSLATIANCGPDNLAILVLDNESFGETGRQSGLTAGNSNIAEIARGCGFAYSLSIQEEGQVEAAARLLLQQPGPVLVVAKVALGDDAPVLPSLDGAYLARRLRESLGLRN